MKKTLLTTCLATALGALLTPTVVQAAQFSSSPISISLAVNSPTCTITNSMTAIPLPPASAGQTIASYQTQNLPIIASTATKDIYTASTLTQTAIISCNFANTPIQSFIVKPGPNAVLGGTPAAPKNAFQYLVDTSPTPVKAGNASTENFSIIVEQLSVNGSPALTQYRDGSSTQLPYTTTFFTGALSTGANPTSIATVVWRPIIYIPPGQSDTFANPTGGSFNGSFQIQINY